MPQVGKKALHASDAEANAPQADPPFLPIPYQVLDTVVGRERLRMK